MRTYRVLSHALGMSSEPLPMCAIQSELAGGFRGVLERAMRVGAGSLHLNGRGQPTSLPLRLFSSHRAVPHTPTAQIII